MQSSAGASSALYAGCLGLHLTTPTMVTLLALASRSYRRLCAACRDVGQEARTATGAGAVPDDAAVAGSRS